MHRAVKTNKKKIKRKIKVWERWVKLYWLVTCWNFSISGSLLGWLLRAKEQNKNLDACIRSVLCIITNHSKPFLHRLQCFAYIEPCRTTFHSDNRRHPQKNNCAFKWKFNLSLCFNVVKILLYYISVQIPLPFWGETVSVGLHINHTIVTHQPCFANNVVHLTTRPPSRLYCVTAFCSTYRRYLVIIKQQTLLAASHPLRSVAACISFTVNWSAKWNSSPTSDGLKTQT